MAKTTAAALMSVARRLSRSASSIVAREVTGHHNLTIDGYRASRKLPATWSATSRTFEAAGYDWRITYHPNNNGWSESIDLYLEPVHGSNPAGGLRKDDPVEFGFSLLDLAGNPVPRYSRAKGLCFFTRQSMSKGFLNFIKLKDLEESGCLKDDRFTVRCDITVIKDLTESAAGGSSSSDDGTTRLCAVAPPPAARGVIVVPPSDLHEHLNNLLSKKQGTDVTVDVGGETTEAHGWLLAARSPVFEAELLAAAAEEKVPGDNIRIRRRMEIKSIEPKVFKAMLHFMYTDALPATEERDTVAMVQGLVAVAHRCKLERLKLMCEETLCRRIDVDAVASILAVAELHDCGALKDACMEFIARPGILKAAMATEGFEKMKTSCPSVMLELVMKQLAA